MQTLPRLLNPELPVDTTEKRIFILMACYNGARYLEEQIRSIQGQRFANWRLIARDDGSKDDTVEIIERFARMDSRIALFQDDYGNLGPIGNFSALIAHALQENAGYVFLADQDDRWHADKLGLMLAGMFELERQASGKPCLVHCDLAVVDAQLNVTAPSFTKHVGLVPAEASLGILLRQNQVTGCACLVNRQALELAYPVPPAVFMHDWWLALLCAATGKIGYIAQSLVDYRQHGNNVMGAVSYWRRLFRLLTSLDRWRFQAQTVKRGIRQAGAVLDRIKTSGQSFHPAAMEQLSIYATILDVFPASRQRVLEQYELCDPAWTANLLFKALMLCMRR
ncbi:glycosyltransferase family 2 protein [Bordetella sp. FB-8]|uniref:glycosyltransferase family 2 protein n=1 Tax=Bordetella sp. FB-8 TaxID=1159870 RepID=UPI0018C9ADC9|nr:glycosyltransferase family 2 protein [Bordetella sp. FB-8]